MEAEPFLFEVLFLVPDASPRLSPSPAKFWIGTALEPYASSFGFEFFSCRFPVISAMGSAMGIYEAN